MDKIICHYCDEEFNRHEINTEHIIPKSKGGCNHNHNKFKVCIDCNNKRGNMLMYQWLTGQSIGGKRLGIIATKLARSVDCMIEKHDQIRTAYKRLKRKYEG